MLAAISLSSRLFAHGDKNSSFKGAKPNVRPNSFGISSVMVLYSVTNLKDLAKFQDQRPVRTCGAA
jgi:hypothetical protein